MKKVSIKKPESVEEKREERPTELTNVTIETIQALAHSIHTDGLVQAYEVT